MAAIYSLNNLPRTRRHATLGRSWRLLESFRWEQRDPARFYGLLAHDTAELVECLRWDVSGSGLAGCRVLDVGGGPGYFGAEFGSRGADYFSVEPDVGEMTAAGIELESSVRGSGTDLPFLDGSFAVTYSSNVAEHIPDFTAMGDEMLRVTAPGGLVVLSYTVWLGPFGGHETGVWPHYLGGDFARRRYERLHGKPPKNVWGSSLFDVSCLDGIRWAKSVEGRGYGDVVGLFPRYHPRWAWWLTTMPIVREFLVSNLVIVIQVNS